MTADPYGHAFDEVGVELRCQICRNVSTKVTVQRGRIMHRLPWPPKDVVYWRGVPQETEIYKPCPDWDFEWRHAAEPLGVFRFAWLPKTCRNGTRIWLGWVERHSDGTFTRGDRAG